MCVNAGHRRSAHLFAAGLLLVLLVTGCENDPITPDPRPPDFELTDLEGNVFKLSQTQGSVVILTFFAPWCPVCQSEAPVLGELYEEFHHDGLEIVAVAVQADSLDQIRAFKDDLDVPYRILVDDGRVSSAAGYGVANVPTTYFIDRDVNLYGPFGHLEKEQFETAIQRYL